jgi:hypothetical protein
MGAGINAGGNPLLGFFALLAGILYGYGRIRPYRKKFFLAVNAIFEPPELTSSGRDKQKKPSTIKEFIRLALWFSAPDFHVAQWLGSTRHFRGILL